MFLMIKHNTFINVRKLAALDIVFHGKMFILVEFALAVFICAAVGLSILHGANHSPFNVILGSFFLGVSLNYIPLLLYTISIVKHKSAQQEVAYELEHKDRYAGKYTRQSIPLLLMPLAMLLLAVYQDLQKRSHQ
jgi:RsiW-degrading membrane proteinase PrsW (M82 family)